MFVESIKTYRYGNADENDSNAHESGIRNCKSTMLVNFRWSPSKFKPQKTIIIPDGEVEQETQGTPFGIERTFTGYKIPCQS
jgi:hypothetical protein